MCTNILQMLYCTLDSFTPRILSSCVQNSYPSFMQYCLIHVPWWGFHVDRKISVFHVIWISKVEQNTVCSVGWVLWGGYWQCAEWTAYSYHNNVTHLNFHAELFWKNCKWCTCVQICWQYLMRPTFCISKQNLQFWPEEQLHNQPSDDSTLLNGSLNKCTIRVNFDQYVTALRYSTLWAAETGN